MWRDDNRRDIENVYNNVYMNFIGKSSDNRKYNNIA